MITNEQLARIILEMRTSCRAQHPTDFDFLRFQERAERLGHVSEELKDYLMAQANQPIDQLCRMIETPRMLKTVLRHVLRTWDTLHGEIDFDDLLVATAIRFAAPGAFDFLLGHFRAIRALRNRGISDETRERTQELDSKWKRIPTQEWDLTTARELIAFLFPMWPTERFGARPAPQGVAVASPTDYWLRLLAGAIAMDEVRDQETVQAIQKWALADTKEHFRGLTLADALATHTTFAGKFEQIAPFFLDGKQFRKLASSLFSRMLESYGVRANRESTPGFTALWRCAIRHPIEPDVHREWIFEQIARYLPDSLRFANDLYYFWAVNEEREVSGGRDSRQLRTAVVEEAKRLYSEYPGRFVRVLDPAFMYSSYHFAVLNGEPKQGGPGFVPKDWGWFAHLLLEAGKLAPDIIIPQISVFLCKEDVFAQPYSCKFEEDKAKDLFGDEFGRLLDLLRREVDLSRFDDRERHRIATVREAAIGLIAKQRRQ